ncbi:HAD-IIIC family phosphatase [Edaphobacter modestus]|uniref:HAD superfamily phosphatase (TIGR01681 family)/FkbH-like protein n=1 Tax=Edaphobacter modestus TaxID=388466 RepID=A0A4Q7YXH8_9BACT|nr:HAD-IIIC family phosphatase [Edaphobacter modestus]RZU42460.1 HAD superfamily phosphatase (TIGR01681 family)/FkbH-like protein [Edaphobacter modestus]
MGSEAVVLPQKLKVGVEDARELLGQRSAEFWPALRAATRDATDFSEVLSLATLRKKALKAGIVHAPEKTIRVAMVGGSSLYPLHELVQQMIGAAAATGWWETELWKGDYDNYISEILDPESELYASQPDVIFLVPSNQRCTYHGAMTDPHPLQRAEATKIAEDLLSLCRMAHERSGAEVILANFLPAAEFDPGPFRVRTLGSNWSFRKLVNLELGLGAPSYVHICDAEFLATRRGAADAHDPRAWFETKQLYSSDFAVDIAKEVAAIVASLHRSSKKVLALDLDNTLWGGVIGDDGMTGIEIGGTHPRGEAFKQFQLAIASLAKRGVVLAVCSKNDYKNAAEPFEKHPEMVLRLKDIACFQANWEPKSENLRRIAQELNLGLDSIVFVDDNPAEIEIVKQFVPEIETIWLGPDPAEYASQLLNSRFFESRSITGDDLKRGEQYQQQAARSQAMNAGTDMDAYLASLEMHSVISEFTQVDVPRISQLINKSNQFNVTTRRRSEAEVEALLADQEHYGFSVRLADKFGDNGLISVVVVRVEGATAIVDTWLMSCRVLKRQMEDEVVNEIVRVALQRGCTSVVGHYLPTEKNGMVRDLFPRMGFSLVEETPERATYQLITENFEPGKTHIQIDRRAYDAN